MNPIFMNIIVGLICSFITATITIKIKFSKDESYANKSIFNILLILIISVSYIVIFYKSIIIIFSNEPITTKSALILLSNLGIIFGIIIYVILEYLSRAFEHISALKSMFTANFKIVEEITGLIRIQTEMIKILSDDNKSDK